MTTGKYNRRAGVRFTYLLRQLEEEGWTQTAIAEAIGCHQTLISKWWWRGAISHELTQKGLRDDVIQGITDGLRIRSDYLFMPTPKEYHHWIRLPSGETRPVDTDELDYRDFKLVTNAEFQQAREHKRLTVLEKRVESLEAELKSNNRQLAQLLALLAREAPAR